MKKIIFIAALVLIVYGCAREQNGPGDEPVSYSVAVTSSPVAGGSATANGGGNTAASIETTPGVEVELAATPAEGYVFAGWSVVSGGAILSDAMTDVSIFTMPVRDVSIKALFAKEQWAITVSGDGHGTVQASVEDEAVRQAAEGDVVTLTATPNSGYAFSRWVVVEGEPLDILPDVETDPATFTMPGRAVAVKAEFVSTTPHTALYGVWKYVQPGATYWYQVRIGKDEILYHDYSGDTYTLNSLTWSVIDNEGSDVAQYPTGYKMLGTLTNAVDANTLTPDGSAYERRPGYEAVCGWFLGADGKSLKYWNINLGGQLNTTTMGPFVRMLDADTRVSVGAQSGTMKAGTAGASVTFPVTVTTNIYTGSYEAQVAGLPSGVSVGNGGKVDINSKGTGTLTLQGDGVQTADIYNGLTLTLEGFTSEDFTLEITL